MASQWDNFLQNLGEWRGSFSSLDAAGAVVESTPSILTLERGAQERLVHFRLRRFAGGDLSGEPSRDMTEDYRNLGKQVVFFDSGTFCKGRLQVAPGTPFGGEGHGLQNHRVREVDAEAFGRTGCHGAIGRDGDDARLRRGGLSRHGMASVRVLGGGRSGEGQGCGEDEGADHQ